LGAQTNRMALARLEALASLSPPTTEGWSCR